MASIEAITNLQQLKDCKKIELYEVQKKVFQLENEIIDIDNKLASFSDKQILETLKLSEMQKKIVDATEDYILVVACPGSGKTHTLISRYTNLILNNITTPEETLLITFTKKAGMEMLNRLSKILPHKIPRYVGSLHGLGYKVLQEYLSIGYSVLDEKDVSAYLKDLFLDMSVIKHMESLEEDDINMIKSKIQLVFDQASVTYPYDMKIVLKKNNLEKYTKENATETEDISIDDELDD